MCLLCRSTIAVKFQNSSFTVVGTLHTSMLVLVGTHFERVAVPALLLSGVHEALAETEDM